MLRWWLLIMHTQPPSPLPRIAVATLSYAFSNARARLSPRDASRRMARATQSAVRRSLRPCSFRPCSFLPCSSLACFFPPGSFLPRSFPPGSFRACCPAPSTCRAGNTGNRTNASVLRANRYIRAASSKKATLGRFQETASLVLFGKSAEFGRFRENAGRVLLRKTLKRPFMENA